MNINESMDFINSFSRLGGKITNLSRVRGLMEKLDNPQNKLKFIHIAGTNGKGSTVEFIGNTLENAGYKVGKFTSPFILHYRDRIRVNSCDIDEKSLCEIAQVVEKNVDNKEYSQFEITMAIGFLYFIKCECDIVVLETGLGGLLDCTNIIPSPLVTAITSISLDHTAILGNTVEEIAVQKAGIIKEKSITVLSTDNEKSVESIVKQTAFEKGNIFCQPNKSDLEIVGKSLDGTEFIYKNIRYKTGMIGSFQVYNALTAIEVCNYLNKNYGFKITNQDIEKSISTSKVKARLQYIVGNPTIIVDGGHNPSALKVLFEEMMFEKNKGKKIYTITGMSDTKDYVGNLKWICEFSDKIFLVDDFMIESVSVEKLAKTALKHNNIELDIFKSAFEKAKSLAIKNNGIIVICGSLYLASEFLNNY